MNDINNCFEYHGKYSDASYSHIFLNQLYEMQQSNDMCDIVLIAENKKIQVHKLVLLAVSPYFRILNNKQFKEGIENKIEFCDISINTLEILIHFMYTGELKITEINVFELMAAENRLQISFLKLLISKFLISALNTTNCLQFLAYTQLYNYTEISSITLKYITKNFHNVIQEDSFVEAPSEIIKLILCQRGLLLSQMLTALDKWLKHKECLIELYDSSELTIEYLELQKLIIKEKYVEFLDVVTIIIDFIKKYFCCNNLLNYQLEEHEVILALGGESSKGIKWSNVEAFTSHWSLFVPKKDSVIPRMQNARTAFTATVSLANDFVYVVGGSGSGQNNILNSCEIYDIENNKWRNMTELPERICCHATAWIDNKLVVTGGQDGQSNILNTVWEYLINDNCWRKGIPMKDPRACHAACNVLGTLYVLGGKNETTKLSSVERYNSVLRKWTKVSEIPQGLCAFGCVVMKENILVVGGLTSVYLSDKLYAYNTILNTWREFETMPSPKYDFGCVLREEKIYCIGGECEQGSISNTYIYNPSSRRWHHSTDRLHTEKSSLCAVNIVIYTDIDDNKI